MKATLVIALLATISLQAGTLIDTSPPNNNATDIVNSRLADDFTLGSAAVIKDIDFWYQAQFQSDLSNVAYAFYANSGGTLGSVLASGLAIPSTSTDTNAFLASFSIANVSLGAGTYWLELHAGSTLTDNSGFTVWWAASDATSTYQALQNTGLGLPGTPITVGGFEQYAFQLGGTRGGSPVPESCTILLAGCGLAGLVLAKTLRDRDLKDQPRSEPGL